MEILKHAMIWLSRIAYCRGFGVQSPWAYRMVRYVINEHYPYYCYQDLRQRFPDVTLVEWKLGTLSMRLANHVHPHTVIRYGDDCAFDEACFKAGCMNAAYKRVSADEKDVAGAAAEIVRISPQGEFAVFFHSVAACAQTGTVVMIEGICRNKEAKALWKDIVDRLPGVVTFDLYYCGLVFFEEKRYKQNYIINF